MSLTGVQVAELVANHLTNIYSSNPDVEVERNYFPSMERGDYAKGKYKINVWPAALSSESVARGRGTQSRSLSRTIGVTVISRAESTLDANDKIAKLSQSTGLAVDTLNSYSLAAEIAGTNIEGLSKGVGRLQRNIFDAVAGLKSSAEGSSSLLERYLGWDLLVEQWPDVVEPAA